ncbi:thiamine pyrophosphate-binding protein [Sphaerisporangium album]|uniref:Thiamine pyrophosphate-binding protein n=1 Tax=Sphaerisporangium album TaxID=509200 RepID=A0A367FJ27_9ACTN|nr:thiamine pyrophosphate-binding protein [Sphaerisporangium album]RCG29707.1 thiamine pyrophosphate-binding protein [Sphaerisporangium album]
MAASRPARVAIIEQFQADGITHIFGNPGTVEQGFLDELRRFPDIQYVLALHEAAAVGIADGWARSTRRPALVQLHYGVGLGNGIGMLYEALRGQTPMVVIAGEAGVAYDGMDAQGSADLVGMAKLVTKWSTRVVNPRTSLRMLRRAFKIAATPPYGPVLVVLPADVMDAETDEAAVPTSFLDAASSPSQDSIAQAARLLSAARHPIVIAGDGIHFSGAQDALARLAETWGAEVWGADWSEVNMAADHPLYRGELGRMFGTSSHRITAAADAVLVCGTYLMPEVFPAMDGVFAPGAKVVHIDLDGDAIAKNYPVDLGLVADPRHALGLLADALEVEMTPRDRAAAAERMRDGAAHKAEALAEARARDLDNAESLPLSTAVFAHELAKHLPEDVMIFDEALSSSPAISRYLRANRPGHWHKSRGRTLGVGVPGAVGMKIANPGRTVIGFAGDGGTMYTLQALWTAARYNIAAKFVICNNGRYRTLDDNVAHYWGTQGIAEHPLPEMFDISYPAIGFSQLAASLGVRSVRIEKPQQVRDAVAQALDYPGPFLIDLAISRDS